MHFENSMSNPFLFNKYVKLYLLNPMKCNSPEYPE